MKRIVAILLALLCVLSVTACKSKAEREAEKEAEHQQLIEEMGEKNRIYHEKRERFLSSPLHASGVAYLEAVLEELCPGAERQISVEPGDYLEASDETLSGSVTTPEEARTFFAQAEVSFRVDFWTLELDGETLAGELAARGVSGYMVAGEISRDFWVLDGVSGTAAFERTPGV